jgi:regulator of sigma E protease
MAYLFTAFHVVLLALGFGFVVFFHELGHFLAAKWRGVKVEQFAVGFGPAIVAWRKGIGLRHGTTTPEFDRRIQSHIESKEAGQVTLKEQAMPTVEQVDRAMADLNLSETEYRLNWVPLGGYVKMLGQDDLRPEAGGSDPRAYNNKSIGSRMVIVSAGVIMNVILAAIGFMIVFLIGFHVAPAEVGGILSDSPATMAVTAGGKPRPLQVGDRLLDIDGDPQQDFTKVAESVALAEEGDQIPIRVQDVNGNIDTVYMTPLHPDAEGKDLLAIGIMPPIELRGPDTDEGYDEIEQNSDCYPPEIFQIKPNDVITAINGQAVAVQDYPKLFDALQNADGKNVELTVKGTDGKTRQIFATPQFQTMFMAHSPVEFAGIVPRVQVDIVQPKSPARGQVHPGDVIVDIGQARDGGDHWPNPAFTELTDVLNANGQQGAKIWLKVKGSGDKAPRQTEAIVPTYKIDQDKVGLGVALTVEAADTVIADVEKDTPASKAGLQPGWRIAAVDGHPVANWFEVRRWLLATDANKPVSIDAEGDRQVHHLSMVLTPDAYRDVAGLTVSADLLQMFHERETVRKTSNPLVAAKWGAIETRDFILQFYLTIKRMFQGSVGLGNTMGPVGIFVSGTKIAGKGPDWLIWFLSVISANLAVVNFLPIPVVDGGLFAFLLLEKVQGKPLSAEAQKIVQMVGLALILGVFLLVTYHDITSHLFGM